MGRSLDSIEQEISNINKTEIKVNPTINLSGKKYGRLKVICQCEDYVAPHGRRIAKWLCMCDCGNFTKVQKSALGKVTFSCGCFMRDTNTKTCRNNFKKYNTYDLSGEYGIGYTSKGDEFYFDLEDYDKIKNYCWYVDKDDFIVTNNYTGKAKTRLALHRYVMNVQDDLSIEVDHIRHNRHDVRKNNLRTATPSQNQYNRVTPSSNTSGYKGVYWSKRDGKWVSYINVDKKRIYLGIFESIKDAAEARSKAEIKYHNKWSYISSMKHGGTV